MTSDLIATHVVCLGNELVGDDGIGIRIGRILQQLPLPPNVTVELRYILGFDLLDLQEQRPNHGRLLIVDAMSAGCVPGTCVVRTAAELGSSSLMQGHPCCHVVGITAVLDIARKLWPHVVEHSLLVVGIEGASFADYSTALSEAVRAALPAALERVLSEVGAGAMLVSAARIACNAWMVRDPTVAEVCEPVGA